jgi:transcriptional regulator with XRE-family HTH domain
MTPRAKRTQPVAELNRLGGALRQIRDEKGLKQIEVASGANVTEAQVSELERGRNDARWTTVARILENGLGATFDDLARTMADLEED